MNIVCPSKLKSSQITHWMCDVRLEVLLWECQRIILILPELFSSINKASSALCFCTVTFLSKQNLAHWLLLDEAPQTKAPAQWPQHEAFSVGSAASPLASWRC